MHNPMGIDLRINKTRESLLADPEAGEAILMRYISLLPEDMDAMNLLGQIYRSKNDLEKAKSYYRKALSIMADDEVALYGLADVLRQEGKYEESLSLSEKIILRNRNHGWAHYNLGCIYFILKDYQHSEEEFKLAAETLPDNTAVAIGLAKVYAAQAKLEECDVLCGSLLSRATSDKTVVKQLADIYNSHGFFDKAMPLFEKLVALEPDNPEYIRPVAYLYHRKGLLDKAMPLFEKLVALDPDNYEYARSLAYSYNRKGLLDKAMPLFEKLVALEPDNAEYAYSLADLYNRRGFIDKATVLFDKAVVLFEKLVALEPDNAEYARSLADLYNRRGFFQQATVLYEKLGSILPGDIDLLRSQAKIYGKTGKHTLAIDKCEQILAVSPGDLEILVLLGNIYRYEKVYEKSAQCYAKAIEIDNSCLDARYGMGTLFLENRRFLDAEQEFKAALKCDPRHTHSLAGLADVYKQFNKDKQAAALYQRCKQLTPLFIEPYLGLGNIFIKLRKFDEAFLELKAALEIDPGRGDVKNELEWVIREKKRYELACQSCDSNNLLSKEELKKVTRPRFCALGIVHRCNFRCKMCHIWETKDTVELSVEQWKQFFTSFKEVADDHCQINFAGGEPFLKKGLIDLIRFVNDLGFITAVCTNAYLIDKETAIRLGDSGLRTIALSLDSLNEKRHNFLRGVAGSYARVMEAIELLHKYAPKVELNVLTIILQENLQDLIPLAEWAQRNDKINMINFLALVQPRGNEKDKEWYGKGENKILWPQDINTLTRIIDTLVQMKSTEHHKIGNPVSQMMNYKKYYLNPDEYIRNHIKCNMGHLFLSLNERGYATLCEEREPIGNILEKNIKDIWFSEAADNVREQIRNCNKNCHQIINCCYEEEK